MKDQPVRSYNVDRQDVRVVVRDDPLPILPILEKPLRAFGLTPSEIRLYTYLLYKGASTVSEISKRMGIVPTNIYPMTQSLMKKGLIGSTLTRPVKFFSVGLDKALEALMTQRRAHLLDEVEAMQKVKKDIMYKYQSLRPEKERQENEDEVGKFQILRIGVSASRLLAALNNIRKTLSLCLSKQVFIDLDKRDFMTRLMDSLGEKRFQARFLLDEKLGNLTVERGEVRFSRTSDINSFILVDDRELYYYLDSQRSGTENAVLWTNMQSLTKIFYNIFELSWKTSGSESSQETVESREHQNFALKKEDFEKLFSICGLKHEKDSIKGISGIPHSFDLLLQAGINTITIDLISPQEPVTIAQILPFCVKEYDLRGLSNPILILGREPSDEVKRFLRDRKITWLNFTG